MDGTFSFPLLKVLIFFLLLMTREVADYQLLLLIDFRPVLSTLIDNIQLPCILHMFPYLYSMEPGDCNHS